VTSLFELNLRPDLNQKVNWFRRDFRIHRCYSWTGIHTAHENGSVQWPQDAAGRCRPPQDTICSDILGTTKVQATINHDVNQCKAVTNLYQVQFW